MYVERKDDNNKNKQTGQQPKNKNFIAHVITSLNECLYQKKKYHMMIKIYTNTKK